MPHSLRTFQPPDTTSHHSNRQGDRTTVSLSEPSSQDEHIHEICGGHPESGPLWRKLLLNTWFGEIGAMSFSVASLATIVLVLRFYSGKPSPELPYSLTLNAVISILATASKSSLIFAVAGALGQLKWCWFSTSRRLQDLQSFDDASRGPLGSVTMLFSFSWRPMASVAALVTILALAYDPFIQQLLDYPIRQLDKPSAAANTGKASGFYADFEYESNQLTNTVNSGLWAEKGQFERQPPCPSGNCTWPLFRSVGWCSKCADLTSTAKFDSCDIYGFWDEKHQNITCNLALGPRDDYPGEGFGNNVTTVECGTREVPCEGGMIPPGCTRSQPYCGVATEITWSIRGPFEYYRTRENSLLGLFKPLLVLGHAAVNYSGAVPSVKYAEACALTPCARDYRITTVGGVTKVDITDIDYGHMLSNYSADSLDSWQSDRRDISLGDLEVHSPSVDAGDESRPGSGDASLFVIESAFLYASTIGELFEGNRTRVAEDFDTMFDPENWTPSGYGLAGFEDNYSSEIVKKIEITNLSYVIENVAASLTRLGLDLSNDTITGNVTTAESYVRVSWEWLILPIYLEAMAVCLLIVTIFLSHRRQTPLWKSSILPMLYHGIPHHTFDRRPAPDVCGMEGMARDTFAALAPAGEKTSGPRLKRTVKR